MPNPWRTCEVEAVSRTEKFSVIPVPRRRASAFIESMVQQLSSEWVKQTDAGIMGIEMQKVVIELLSDTSGTRCTRISS